MAENAAPGVQQDWEASKENFQPLKAGRKATALRDSTAELRTKAVEERRRAFWQELDTYNGSDPLEVWLRFIRWTQDTFSAGGHKAELLPLLERCTRELQAAEGGRYRTDIRYLRVWVQYADCLPDPGDVFSFLKHHDIGQDHALYYVALATYLEAQGGYASADSAYQQGINRLAAPLDRLRAKFEEFQQRMARRIQRKAQEQAGLDAAEPDHPERKSLGLLRGGNGVRSARPAGGLLGGSAGLKRKADAENVSDNLGSGLDIFVDEEFCGGDAGGPAASAPAAFLAPGRSAAVGASWGKLAGFEAGRKENAQRPSVWAGQKLKQAAAHSAPTQPTLEVFADPELQELGDDNAGGSAAGGATKPTLRQRLDGGGGGGGAGPAEEGIMQNPLLLHKAQAQAEPLPGLPSRPSDTQPAKRRREEVLAFDEAGLLSSSGEELCFEEARAALWLQHQAAQRQAAEQAAADLTASDAGDDSPDMELEGFTCALPESGTADASAEAVATAAEKAAQPQQQQQQAEEQCASPAPTVLVPELAAAPASSLSVAFGSPVDAKPQTALPLAAAETAAGSWEGSPLPVQALEAGLAERAQHHEIATSPGAAAPPAIVQQQRHTLPPTPFDQAAQLQPTPFDQPLELDATGYEPAVTLSSREAFAAVNQVFGGTLPSDAAPRRFAAGSSGVGGGGAAGGSGVLGGGGLEPTMTIATKDAFAALNKMFKGSLPLEFGSLPANPHGDSGSCLPRPLGGYEPTMTISTRAAFAAVNNMFRGALPGEHASLPPTACGPAAAAGYDQTVTISTREAFEAINSMFGGGGGAAAAAAEDRQPLQQQLGGGGSFRAPLPRPPRGASHLRQAPLAAPKVHAAMAAAPVDSPDRSPGGFCIREDTQFVSVAVQEDEEADVPSDGGFAIREDTQFITVATPAQSDEEEEEAGEGVGHCSTAGSPGPAGDGSFFLREDTQYVTVAVQPQYNQDEEAGVEMAEGGQRAPEPPSPRPQLGSPLGFSIREDTQFVGGLAAAAAGSGGGDSFAIREDTQLVGLDATEAVGGRESPTSSLGGGGGGQRGDSSSVLPRKRPLGELLAPGSCTEDLLGSGGSEGSPGRLSSPGYSAAADAGQVSKWGFAPGADDTLALVDLADDGTQALLDAVAEAEAAGPAAGPNWGDAATAASGGSARSGAGGSPTLTSHLRGLQLGDCKENLMADGAAAVGGSCRRQLCDPGAAAAVLQPLGEARVAALGGVELELDEDAEVELAAGGLLLEGDSFCVWPDGGEDEGSLPLMGSPAASGGSHTGAPGEAATQQLGGPYTPVGEALQYATPVMQRRLSGGCEEEEEEAVVEAFSPGLRGRMLCCLEPSVVEWPGVYCMSGEEEAEADAGFRAASSGAGQDLVELQLCGLEFAVSGPIGEGAFARVFQAVDGECADVALKVEAPPCPWEWYICKALAGRVPPTARRHFIDPSLLLLGGRSSVLVAPLGPQGSLQDLVNAYLAQKQAPPELLAMHFAAQLLRIMQHLHAARVVHTDIKPDNLLVMLGQEATADGDENAGPSLSLQLIDFGRSLDLELLPPGAVLQGDSGTDAFRCVEMREGRPWLWQADAYGVAATVHCLLYGKYMEVERVHDAASGAVSLRPRLPLKRQWAGAVWGPFFATLLNHTDLTAPPAVDKLIASLDQHLGGGRDVPRQLRQDLGRAATLLLQRC